MYYFHSRFIDSRTFSEEYSVLSGFYNVPVPITGDRFSVTFHFRGWSNVVEGCCIKLRKKLTNPEVSFTLRNKFGDCSVEFTISFYYQRVFNLKLTQLKEKPGKYSRAKLYFLRYLEFKSALAPV